MNAKQSRQQENYIVKSACQRARGGVQKGRAINDGKEQTKTDRNTAAVIYICMHKGVCV